MKIADILIEVAAKLEKAAKALIIVTETLKQSLEQVREELQKLKDSTPE